VAVEHDDGMRHENGRHGKRLGGTDAHCEKALPVTANDSAAGAEVFEDSSDKLDNFDRGLWSNTGSLYSGGLRDK